MTRIFHITTREQWKRASESGAYMVDSLDTEGFIHCSRLEQVAGVANRLYSGRADLILLRIDPQLVQAEIRYEGEAEQFPHVYGPINIDAVTGVKAYLPASDGHFRTTQDAGFEKPL